MLADDMIETAVFTYGSGISSFLTMMSETGTPNWERPQAPADRFRNSDLHHQDSRLISVVCYRRWANGENPAPPPDTKCRNIELKPPPRTVLHCYGSIAVVYYVENLTGHFCWWILKFRT